jgi:hypothetical protein
MSHPQPLGLVNDSAVRDMPDPPSHRGIRTTGATAAPMTPGRTGTGRPTPPVPGTAAPGTRTCAAQ